MSIISRTPIEALSMRDKLLARQAYLSLLNDKEIRINPETLRLTMQRLYVPNHINDRQQAPPWLFNRFGGSKRKTYYWYEGYGEEIGDIIKQANIGDYIELMTNNQMGWKLLEVVNVGGEKGTITLKTMEDFIQH